MTWTAPAPQPVDGPLTGADRPMLEGYLGWQRATFLNICAGLTAEQLALRPVPSSNLSLLGLIRHLAKVERFWFQTQLTQIGEPLFDTALGKDHDFEHLDPAQAQEAVAVLGQEMARSREIAAELDVDVEFTARYGSVFSLRMLLVHMIGEYARHNGHADLLREAIDGTTAR